MDIDYNNYYLIGIGDFSHGNNNIWEYRLNLLKHIIKNTTKKIVIYNEDTIEHCKNIMNKKKKLSYYKSYGVENNYGYGPLDKYCFRVYDSPIYLEMIKYIRKNINRIKIIGVVSGDISRDKKMSENILKDLDKKNINLFFGHNSHINNQKITEIYETKWHNEKYRCGYYLKKKLKNKYCIILSAGYKGKIRFDCYCDDKLCTNRIPYKKPILKDFQINEYKNIKDGFYNKFDKKLCSYTACIFLNNNCEKLFEKKYDYVLFFKNVKSLELVK